MTPRPFAKRTPSPSERAAADQAAKRYELDEAAYSGPGEGALESGDGPGPGLGGSMRVYAGVGTVGPDDDFGSLAFEEGLVDHPDVVPAMATTAAPVPMWRQMLEVFVQNKLAVISTIILVLIVLGCFVGPHFYVTNQTNLSELFACTTCIPNQAPSSAHLLGTDGTGYDVLGRIMFAGQYSLALGFFAGLITIVVGTVYGMASGFFGGITDSLMMRLIDAALSIPYLFLLVALVSIFHNGTTFLILVIGLTGWWANSRIIRGDALAIRDLDYSVAATSMGASRRHVIRRHVFPNSISNIVTVGTLSIADAILALSALGFIGIGIQLPAYDWGKMMFDGSNQLIDGAWWEVYPVAFVFVLVILCINYIGDALRDTFEVRLRRR